jgi:type III secretory pathway component EscS
VRVHWQRFREGTQKALYSLAFFVGFFLALFTAGWFGIQHSLTRALVDFVVVPIEASLFVVILVTLIYALTRLLYHRFSLFYVVFLITVLVSLLVSIPWFGVEIPLVHGGDSLLSFATRILGTGGIRGLLIGVALGSVVSGIRILLGLDRPFGE